MEESTLADLVERLRSDDAALCKMSAFKLQSLVGDPAFADKFIAAGGMAQLRKLIVEASGNTLAYTLMCFTKILEVDRGWDFVDQTVIKRVVELVVTHPLVNILRGAMSILVHVVSYPYKNVVQEASRSSFGFRSLKPAIALFPQFLEMLVIRLSSADHALCANAVQLINALMRDAVTSSTETEWSKFIKRLQDLGVVEAVYDLMQGDALQDFSGALLDFQTLMKVLLRKWIDLPVDLDRPDHNKAIRNVCRLDASDASGVLKPKSSAERLTSSQPGWREIGFKSASPGSEFQTVGYLGLMDLMNFVRKADDDLQQQLLEQATKNDDARCSIAQASLLVTRTLINLFRIEDASIDRARFQISFDAIRGTEGAFQPFILQWSTLHIAGLQAFFRLWAKTDAKAQDMTKIGDLVTVLFDLVISKADRRYNIGDFQKDILHYDLADLRQSQMERFELGHQKKWQKHIDQIREELRYEALQFIKEQRIRCLLAGSWFPKRADESVDTQQPKPFRYARLSPTRRHIHYCDFPKRTTAVPSTEELSEKIELALVSSVTSDLPVRQSNKGDSSETVADSPRIVLSKNTRSNLKLDPERIHHLPDESTLLVLDPESPSSVAEWVDGLLMLLDQRPVMKETTELLDAICDYGMKIRLLNVRPGDLTGQDPKNEGLPDRTGLDEPFYYQDFLD